ncbi:sulfotransferase domain-containing protein [Coraliomargarita parva]|uniref:sulfotransferase domain-containing protein n=1 Tax=Coraliomargarita parva TaxID=3014050 RepID=UPI0022B31CBA|nr:sulfotransferase domain-containing protein [Coraliomargarita parva]
MPLKSLFARFRKTSPPAVDVLTSHWILSYPKSGRTWLRVMIGRIFTQHFGLSEEQIFDEKTMTVAAGLPPVDFSHDETSNSEGRALQDFTETKGKYAENHVMLLVRDPRDVVVSCFFQATRRKSRYEGDIHDFIRSDTHGIRKIIRYYQIWDANKHLPASFTLLRYEDMHEEPHQSLRNALNFLGAAGVSDSEIADAVEYASFESMKAMEASNSLKNKKLRPGDKNDPESYKVRKGKIGGYVDYLDEADIAYCEQALQEMQCPFGYSE